MNMDIRSLLFSPVLVDHRFHSTCHGISSYGTSHNSTVRWERALEQDSRVFLPGVLLFTHGHCRDAHGSGKSRMLGNVCKVT